MLRPLLLLAIVTGLAALVGGNAPTYAAPLPQRLVDTNYPQCIADFQPTYTSIDAAVQAANISDTIFVCPGTYVEPTINVTTTSLKILGPTVNGLGGTATVQKSTLNSTPNVFNVTADSVIIRGLDIDATPQQGYNGSTTGFQVDGSYGEISDNTIHDVNGDFGVEVHHIPPPIGATVARNHITNGGRGIYCLCNFSYIQDNVIGPNVGTSGLYLSGGDTNLVSNNTLNGTGIFAVATTNTTFDGNTIDGTGAALNLLAASGHGLTFSNNTFENDPINTALYLVDGPPDNTSATVIKNTFDNVGTGILLNDRNTGDAYKVSATIGGSVEDHNTFRNSGIPPGSSSTQEIGPGQLLYLINITDPVDAEYNDWGRCTLAQIENVVHHKPDDAALGTVDYDPFIAPASCATPTPTPSPTPTASPTPSATPTPSASPTPTTAARRQGDVNCDGFVDGLDALRELRNGAGLTQMQPSGCPNLGMGSPKFGDVNCDGAENAGDATLILQYAAEVTIGHQPSGCTALGELLPG